jgi:methionine-rich copper-binding protein CopC
MMMRKVSLMFIMLGVLLLFPRSAQAHASLIESTPAANSVVGEPPATATLRFTEPMEPSYSRATLLGPDGTQISTTPSRLDPNDPYVMLLDLPVLPEGRYVIQWRALSTADGHTSQGTVSFGIGDPQAANAPLVLPPPPPDPLALPSPLEVALRWLAVPGRW